MNSPQENSPWGIPLGESNSLPQANWWIHEEWIAYTVKRRPTASTGAAQRHWHIATRIAGSSNSPPRIRRIPHRESADFLTANSPTSPPRIPYREFAYLSLSLANIDQWIRGESMANVRPIICVIGEYHSSRIRRIKFVWIRGEYSPRKFQMNSTVVKVIYHWKVKIILRSS